MTERDSTSLLPLPLFFLSLPPLSVCLSSGRMRNTLLYLHPNDPSSGPRGWALCITQRSIRARAQRLLCPIINPYQLLLSLSHCHFSGSPTCPASAPLFLHLLHLLHGYFSVHMHKHRDICIANQSPTTYCRNPHKLLIILTKSTFTYAHNHCHFL